MQAGKTPLLCDSASFSWDEKHIQMGHVHMQVSKARKVWAEEEQGDSIDDCTVIVAILSIPSAVGKTINLSAGAGIASPAVLQHAPAALSQSSRSCSQMHAAVSSKLAGGRVSSQNMGCVPRF